MPSAKPPRTFITNKGSMLPRETQEQLLEERETAINSNELQRIAVKRLGLIEGENQDSFARLPTKLLQDAGRFKELPGKAFNLYMWLIGFANHMEKPKGDDKVFYDLDQWYRAGFIATARKREDIATIFGVSERTISYWLHELENMGLVKIVHKYATGWTLNTNVYILGYRVRTQTSETTVWLGELKSM